MNFFGKKLSKAELDAKADEVLSQLAPKKVLSPSEIKKANQQKEFESMVEELAKKSEGAVAGESELEEKEIPKPAKQLREEEAEKRKAEREAAAAKKIEERGAAAAKRKAEREAAAAKIKEGRKQSKQQSKKMVGDLFDSLKVGSESDYDFTGIGNGAEAGQTLDDLMDEFGANGVEAGETEEQPLDDLMDEFGVKEEEGKTGGKKRTMRKKNRKGTKGTRTRHRKNRTRTMRKKSRKSRKSNKAR